MIGTPSLHHGGAMSSSEQQQSPGNHQHTFTFFVNNQPFQTPEHTLTGNQIKGLAGLPGDYELYEVRGHETVPVSPTEEVHIHEGAHFRAIPAGTFGRN
jgi:hypothetical protein